jgi:diguanylate cyclase (GGDEF)-like protein
MFSQRIEAETSLRVRFRNPLSIILMDVDHFKQINDTYGHPVGDQVLQKIGSIIADLCRTEDVPCRFGGEEFVIITPHTAGTDAVILSDRIRETLERTRIKPERVPKSPLHGQGIVVTASFGVAEAGAPDDRSMLQRADDAMYRSKQEGRNRVSLAPPALEMQAANAAQ